MPSSNRAYRPKFPKPTKPIKTTDMLYNAPQPFSGQTQRHAMLFDDYIPRPLEAHYAHEKLARQNLRRRRREAALAAALAPPQPEEYRILRSPSQRSSNSSGTEEAPASIFEVPVPGSSTIKPSKHANRASLCSLYEFEEIGYKSPKDHAEMEAYVANITGARGFVARFVTFNAPPAPKFVEPKIEEPVAEMEQVTTVQSPTSTTTASAFGKSWGFQKIESVLGIGMECPTSMPKPKPPKCSGIPKANPIIESAAKLSQKVIEMVIKPEPEPEPEPDMPQLKIVHTSHNVSQAKIMTALCAINPEKAIEEWTPALFSKYDNQARVAKAEREEKALQAAYEASLAKCPTKKPPYRKWALPPPIPTEFPEENIELTASVVPVPCRLHPNLIQGPVQPTIDPEDEIPSDYNPQYRPRENPEEYIENKCFRMIFENASTPLLAKNPEVAQSAQEVEPEEENPVPIFIRPGYFDRELTQEQLLEHHREAELKRIAQFPDPPPLPKKSRLPWKNLGPDSPGFLFWKPTQKSSPQDSAEDVCTCEFQDLLPLSEPEPEPKPKSGTESYKDALKAYNDYKIEIRAARGECPPINSTISEAASKEEPHHKAQKSLVKTVFGKLASSGQEVKSEKRSEKLKPKSGNISHPKKPVCI